MGVTASAAARAGASPFPAQHFPLVPVDAEPLQKGFVEVIHPEGPQVYAHVYQFNGGAAALGLRATPSRSGRRASVLRG